LNGRDEATSGPAGRDRWPAVAGHEGTFERNDAKVGNLAETGR
jgi:hypothetical protein